VGETRRDGGDEADGEPKRPRNKAALVKHVIRKITSKLENDD